MEPRILKRLELSVIAIAVVVRVCAWGSLHLTRYADHPLVDAYTYWDQARKLAAGKDAFVDGFYQPPGYPYILSLIQRAFGSDAPDIPRLLQLVLGLITTILLIRIGRVLGARVGASWSGAAAGLLYSLYPTTLLFEMDLLTPALTSVCAVGSVAVLMGGLSGRRCLIAGLLLGLAATAHPTYLLGGIAAVAWAWWADRARVMPALALALGLGLALSPVTVTNVVKFKQLSLTSSNAGINFYMGNNLGWRETSFLRPGLRFRKLALEAEPHKRDGQARDDYWMQRALDGIADAPLAWAGTLLTKAHWSVHDTEIPRNEDYRCRLEDEDVVWPEWLPDSPPQGLRPLAWLGALPVRFGWVFPLALAGVATLWRKPARKKKSAKSRPELPYGRLVLGLWLVMHLPVIAFIVSDRYRLATWPWLALAAPLGVHALMGLYRARRRPHPAWLLLLVAAVLPWLPIDERTQMRPGWCAHVSANLAYMDGELQDAEANYRKALLLNPGDIDAHNWLARTLARRGEVAEAAAHVDVILSEFPDHFPTLKFQAGLMRRQGERSAAADLLLRAYRVPGNRTNTGAQAVKALRAAGRSEEARALMEADPKVARRLK